MTHRNNNIFLKSTQQMAEKLAQIQQADHNAQFALNRFQELKINIRPDPQMARALFKPDPLLPGGFVAHPITIRAMRKDLFVASADIDELTRPYTCPHCSHELDQQFWHFCPYCENSFVIEVIER